jgi:hypothetical protein
LNWIDRLIERPHPQTAKELRRFGLMMGIFIGAVFGLLFPWLWNLKFVWWPWAAGGLFILWALIAPATLAPVYHGWMIFGGIMGWINTRIILALLFYLLFFPLGRIMRLRGWDPLRRGWKTDLVSYRIPSKPADRKQMEKPY